MYCKQLRSALFVSTALSLGMIASALAETVPNGAKETSVAQNDNGAQQIEEITVTARRVTERLQDVPISITVFNQQELTNHNVINASDLAQYTPSLQANTNYGTANTTFAIRGFAQDSGTQPSVGVFFADVVAPRGPTQGTQAGDGAGPGDLFDLQSVQVLKGPQGTLFGLNTTGGDVLLVPNKPTDEFGGYVQGSFGNYNMEGAQAVLNIPVNDSIRLRFGVDHMNRSGYLQNTSGVGPSNFDDADYTALRASADIDVTSNLENYTIATYSVSNTNGDVQKMIACDPAAGTLFVSPLLSACSQLTPHAVTPLNPTPYQGGGFYDASQADTDPYTDVKQWRVINTTTWQVSDSLTIKNIASYAEFQEKYSSPLFGTNFYTPNLQALIGPEFPPSLSVGFSNVTPIPSGDTANQSTYTEELQLQGKSFGDRLSWQGGLYLEGSDPLSIVGNQSPVLASCTNSAALQCSDPVAYLLALSGAVPPGTPVGAVNYTAGTTNYNDYAAYAQATYKLTDQVKLTGGIRYTEDREAATTTNITNHFGYPGTPNTVTQSCTNPQAVAPGCTLNFLEHSDAPTWLLDAEYTPDDSILAYAKYARGYRAGLIVQNITSPYNYVGPERVDNYEIGAKTSFEGQISGTFDVDGFYNDFAHQQLLLGFDPNPCFQMIGTFCVPAPVSPSAAPVNAGTSHIFGAEVESAIIPFSGLTLNFGYTYLHTQLISVRTFQTPAGSYYVVAGAQRVGDQLPLSPHNKFVLSGTYKLPIDDSIGSISVGVTFTHTDAMLTNYDDVTTGSAIFKPLGDIQATNLLDFSLNWNGIAGKPLDLSVFATNVTGQKYYTWLPGLAPDTGFETAEIGQPTMYGARLKIHFGDD